MAKRVTINHDGTLAAVESGERLRFVSDDGRGCRGCFFDGRCVSSGEYVFATVHPACMPDGRNDGRTGHWEKAY